jgi:glycosyltransferase involved in cell wall biosynthesis
MKWLLVSDIPPCTNYTAGLVLDQLCRFLPPGSIACSIVRNRDLTDAVVTADLGIPVDYIVKPCERVPALFGKGGFSKNVASYALETYQEFITCRRLVDRIVRFGRDFGADAVWCVLQGQTEVRVARPVAAKLGGPLFTMTWDPLQVWLDAHEVNPLTQRRVLRQFGAALRASDGFAAASWAMADEYARKYGVRAVPLVPGLDASFAMPPAGGVNAGDEFIIGAAGKIYPPEIWQAFVAALQSANWTIAGRKVRIRALTRWCPLPWEGLAPVQLLGWHSQQDTVRILSEADVLLCPYWLDPAYAEATRLSFPGKLVTYLATGRPVMFLGPADASPARFLRRHDAGVMCHSAEAGEILRALRRLCEEPDLYARLARNGRKAFDQYLTLDAVRRRFAEFLRVPEEYLVGGVKCASRAA